MPAKSDLTVYVFVRRDIPVADQIVQAGHACIQATCAFAIPSECRLVVLSVRDEEALRDAVADCGDRGIRAIAFFEPDSVDTVGGSPMGWTAAATEPLPQSRRRLLSRYRLWSP